MVHWPPGRRLAAHGKRDQRPGCWSKRMPVVWVMRVVATLAAAAEAETVEASVAQAVAAAGAVAPEALRVAM